MIHGLKFGKRLQFGRFLGEQLIKTLESEDDLVIPELIIPVPLHRKRFLERGFNQAREIAIPVAKYFHVPLVSGTGVERFRYTPEQSLLDAKQRKRNLQGAFRVNADVNGKSIAIVDDVMTTGATATELSKALIRAGARRVEVWLAARVA